jgi:hypothetical protein
MCLPSAKGTFAPDVFSWGKENLSCFTCVSTAYRFITFEAMLTEPVVPLQLVRVLTKIRASLQFEPLECYTIVEFLVCHY